MSWEGGEGKTEGWREWQSVRAPWGPHTDRGFRKEAEGAVFRRKVKALWVQAELLWGSPTNTQAMPFF